MADGTLRIGTSGWSYSNWKGGFYPSDLPSSRFFEYYAGVFSTVELNSSFYHMPRETTIAKWYDSAPDGFVFCPKMSKVVTHLKKLKDMEKTLEEFLTRFRPLLSKMGPVLIQLPPGLQFQPEVTERFYNLLKQYGASYRFALEARHASWFTDTSLYLIQEHNIIFVIAEAGSRFPSEEVITSDTVYLRLHGSPKLYASSYSEENIQRYAAKIKEWRQDGTDVYVFFNNTMYGHAIENALLLKEITL